MKILILLLKLFVFFFAYFIIARNSLITFIRDDIPIFRNTWKTTLPSAKISIRLAVFLYILVPYVKWALSDHGKTLDFFKEYVTPFLYGLAEALLAVGFIIFLLKVNRKHLIAKADPKTVTPRFGCLKRQSSYRGVTRSGVSDKI